MAPRGRPKKRYKRMDAAVETMTKEYGIPDVKLIKKVANQLLDEYGGGDGAWYFIEQYTYKELLEAIIRYNQEANSLKNDGQVNFGRGGDSIERGTAAKHDAPESAAGSSSILAESVCPEDVKNGPDKDKGDSDLPSTERDGKGWKDICLDQSSDQREMCNALHDIGEKNGSNENLDTGLVLSPVQLIPTTPLNSSVASQPNNSPLLSPLSVIHSPVTVTSAPPRRRMPCYGWIESDEDDDDYFIDRKPAKISVRRKTRWDLKPEDP